MTRPRIGIIIGSTRPTRFGDIPARWIRDKADATGAFETEIVDLRDYGLPFFDDVASNLWAPTQHESVRRWQEKIAELDGYIFIVAEYNRSITAALKNALDSAYVDWNRKPFGALAYGSMGGARALEHLRSIGTELQMVSTRSAIHIAGADFFKVHPGFGGSGNLDDIEGSIGDSTRAMLADLEWWTNATRDAREADAQREAA
ncbi:MAG: NAD(P)H-dependent oxidoreductase [Rubellimicrobium sp.]|nr:NAD(P)H-dependent oxidoreductase [Rubellimicrobium sp.]